MYIPTQINEKQLLAEACIRQEGRLPSVTYVHKQGCNEEKPKGLGCAIFRSAEPKPELLMKKNGYDEAYIAALALTFKWTLEDEGRPQLYIFSSRIDEKGAGKPGFE